MEIWVVNGFVVMYDGALYRSTPQSESGRDRAAQPDEE